MIPLSRRYAFAALALALLAAVPIWIHGSRAPVFDPCPGAAALFSAGTVGGGTVVGRAVPDPDMPAAGRIDGPIGSRSRIRGAPWFRIERGFEPSVFFGTTRLKAFQRSYAPDGGVELVELDAEGTRLPVYWVEDRLASKYGLLAYMYVHGRQPVADPFWSSVRLAGQQLRTGTRPVTLFLVRGVGREVAAPEIRRAAEDWLRRAWHEYEKACASS